jgi:ATP-dependent Clp protease ATP-binding subunit ClpC
MEIVVLVVGVAIGMAVQRFLGRRGTSGPVEGRATERVLEDEGTKKPAAHASIAGRLGEDAASAAVEPPSLISRLLPLRKAIEEFGELSAHPGEIAERPEFRQAVDILADPSVSAVTVIEYALGSNWPLACAAFAAAPRRADCSTIIAATVPRLKHLGDSPLHFALHALTEIPDRLPVGLPLLDPGTYWHNDRDNLASFTSYFRKREAQGDAASFGAALEMHKRPNVGVVEELLKAIDHPYAATLLAELTRWKGGNLNQNFLRGIGTFWNHDEDELLVEYDAIREPLLTLETAVTRTPPRSLLVVGDSRTGKTTLIRLLARRLAAQGFTVFEAGSAQLQAGQSYIGELEGRIQRMIDELSADKHAIWYVPDFVQIVTSGTHKGQAASILDQILPAMAAGRIIVIGECTPGVLVKIHQSRPAVRNTMDAIRLRAVSTAEAQPVAEEFSRRIEKALSLSVDANVVPSAMQLSSQYLGGMQLPGAVLDLMKMAANRVIASGGSALTRDSVVASLAQVSGLPRAILDDREKTDLASMRSFFTSRVIGQDEAVSAIVDRIAMLKAGLTDPGRPVGVFLFAGPTGTGKTELAKTLAEYLFGTPERLIRLDMSEFQTPDSTWKILGDRESQADTPSLVQKVRKQPFAVVLLDEFEKAHSNVWDLFLQVFDDGRLTDTLGQTVDFRHTLIILTSNLGATVHQNAGVGFTPGTDVFSQAQIVREVAKSFRPEFVNRLDKVIVFRPLSRDRMREILRKELRNVLGRRGLRDREWAVEWESSALEFLLDKGFTATMGARPLKRAIDQHLLAPLAATMVEHRFPSGDQFLFVRSDGQALQVEFVDPDAPEGESGPGIGAAAARGAASPDLSGGSAAPGLGSTILQPAGTRAERDFLFSRSSLIQSSLEAPPWEQLRDSLALKMSAPDFWDRAERHGVLTRFALVDRVGAAAQTARSLLDRYERSVKRPSGQYSKDLAGRLASQLWLVDRGMRDAIEDRPVEVVIAVEPAMEGDDDDTRASHQWCEQVFRMYCDWAAARRMQIARVQDVRAQLPLLVISGFGSHAVLSDEAGLHVLESELNRAVARVRMAPTPADASSDTPSFTQLKKALDAQPATSFVVRRYRFEPSPLVRDARRGWRAGRVSDVMAGNFDLFAGEASH